MSNKTLNDVYYDHVTQILREAEFSSPRSREEAVSALRPLGLEDFGLVLWNMPNETYPILSALLPKMASDDVQIQWTGAAGLRLLLQSVSFVRSCAANYADHSGNSLANKRILDFGCGYGRFLRLFSFYSDDVWGVDPWDKSIEQCALAGFGSKVSISDAIPDQLPFGGPFDFLFAFSVFTHLSERSTIACLNALRRVASQDAMMMITIRPPEFWDIAIGGGTHLPVTEDKKDRMQLIAAAHRLSGFGYYLDEPSFEADYGDTSLSLDWLSANAGDWKIVSVDRSLNDPAQRYVLLRAV